MVIAYCLIFNSIKIKNFIEKNSGIIFVFTRVWFIELAQNSYIWSRVPCSHPPPWDGGGYDAPVVVYIHTYLHTYLPTYIHTITLPYLPTYIHTYHYITLPYITLPYLTFHPYIHTYIPYITLPYLTLPYLTLPYLTFHTYIHTYIPTYQHTNIPPPQATGGGPEEPDDTVHPYPLVGGEGRCTIYITKINEGTIFVISFFIDPKKKIIYTWTYVPPFIKYNEFLKKNIDLFDKTRTL